jgi:N-methylhydantoinase B
MLFDQMFVIEGALRHCEFEVVPGTITCATRPAAVSGSPALTLLQSIGLGGLVISKMLATSSDEALRSEVQSCMGVLSFPINAIQGVDQRGAPFSSFLLDPVGAALSAYSWRDGQDTGGWPWDLQSTMPNVEETELFYPMLFLWRKELPDSGGAGRWRGGNGAELAFVPHRTDGINMFTITSEVAVPGPGIFGGYPSSTNSFVLVHDAKVAEQIARTGRMPGHLAELEGELDMVPAKSFDRRPTPADVWVFGWAGSSGYGDPLQREPERVAEDVAAGRVTAAWAERAYGVVLAGDGHVDAQATGARRLVIRTERLGGTAPSREESGEQPGAGGAQRLTEYLDVVGGDVRSVPSGRMLGPVSENYKLGLTNRELPLTEANPNVRDPAVYTDNTVIFRQLIDPETGTLVATEVVVDGEAPQQDSTIG